jgi:protocatechuate 3,4-dioxygenase beta subunit
VTGTPPESGADTGSGEVRVDRRTLLGAGGLLGLGAVLAACTGNRTSAARMPATGAGRSTPASTTSPAPPPATPSPVDLLAGAGTCTLTPKTIAGPTWFDAHAVRSDVRDGRPGVELALAFKVLGATGCAPVPGAVVDLWHADAGGVYSGFAGAGPGQGGRTGERDQYGDAQARSTDPGRALRGTQATGPDGVVQFTTIYPGWYPTRTPHLHLEVHVDGSTVLTTQLFFDDAVSDAVFAGLADYRRHGNRDTRNATDAFYSPPAQLRQGSDGTRQLAALQLGVPGR